MGIVSELTARAHGSAPSFSCVRQKWSYNYLLFFHGKLTKVDVGIGRRVKNTSKSSHQIVKVEMSHTSDPAGRSNVRSCPVYPVPGLNAPVLSPLENKQA